MYTFSFSFRMNIEELKFFLLTLVSKLLGLEFWKNEVFSGFNHGSWTVLRLSPKSLITNIKVLERRLKTMVKFVFNLIFYGTLDESSTRPRLFFFFSIHLAHRITRLPHNTLHSSFHGDCFCQHSVND